MRSLIRLFAVGFLAALLSAGSVFAQRTSLEILGDVKNPRAWSADDIKKRFAGEIQTAESAGREKQAKTSTGIPLISLLRAAELKTGDTPRNYASSFIVILESHDGYRAWFSFAELASGAKENPVLLVWEQNGKPLPDNELPFRLLSGSGDRGVYGITRITLVDGVKLADSLAASGSLSAISSATDYAKTPINRNLLISTGSDESQLLFTWHDAQPAGALAVRAQGESTYTEIEASSAASRDRYIHKAAVDKLLSSTTYEYSLSGVNSEESTIYTVKTGDPKNFSFFAVGDAQIGATDVATDTESWKKTLNAAVTSFPDAGFLISMGDQVQTADNVSHYNGYLSPIELTGLPTAQSVGNHDSGSPLFLEHYSFPNMVKVGTGTTAIDYWFTYGGALFMVIDSNTQDITAHKSFMENAIAANTGAAWKIAVFHHAQYSEAFHYDKSTEGGAHGGRFDLTPVFDELGIDVALSGHDHSYTRTYHMKGGEPLKNQKWLDADGDIQSDETGLLYSTVLDPDGVLYIALGSSSGSKYYALDSSQKAFFSAARHQFNTPEFSVVDVTGDSFTITTYRADTMAKLDTYTIRKKR